MCSCVTPIYAYLGSQLSSFFNTWTPWTAAWTKRLEIDGPKLANGSKHLLKQPTLKSNVTFKYKELQDATGSFSKKNLVGVGGFAKVCAEANLLVYSFPFSSLHPVVVARFKGQHCVYSKSYSI